MAKTLKNVVADLAKKGVSQGGSTTREIAAQLGVSQKTALEVIRTGVESGVLVVGREPRAGLNGVVQSTTVYKQKGAK
jgi:hypothetical protein